MLGHEWVKALADKYKDLCVFAHVVVVIDGSNMWLDLGAKRWMS